MVPPQTCRAQLWSRATWSMCRLLLGWLSHLLTFTQKSVFVEPRPPQADVFHGERLSCCENLWNFTRWGQPGIAVTWQGHARTFPKSGTGWQTKGDEEEQEVSVRVREWERAGRRQTNSYHEFTHKPTFLSSTLLKMSQRLLQVVCTNSDVDVGTGEHFYLPPYPPQLNTMTRLRKNPRNEPVTISSLS